MPPAARSAESPTGLVRRARKIDRVLAETYPDARCELDFDDPFQLLVVTVLSAQTTDKRVNAVRPRSSRPTRPRGDGRRRARPARDDPRPAGFFRAKTKSCQALHRAARAVRRGGAARLDELVKLPGVGRKTANVVLGNAFDVPGITVDTHFGRLTRRFRWTADTDPVKVEHEVAELIPKKDWTILSHRLIWHGRRICHSRRPACGVCPLARLCPSFGEGPTDPETAAALVKTEGRA